MRIFNFCLSDRTFGWHGRRTGLALYYIDEQHFQDENHELSLTSNMRSFFQIMATHTKLLGRHVSNGYFDVSDGCDDQMYWSQVWDIVAVICQGVGTKIQNLSPT